MGWNKCIRRWITNDFYEEKIRQYDLDTAEIDEKIKRVEKVESSFYVTAGYIVELTKNSSKLFEVSKEEERRLLIKTVLLNIRWDGEKLLYDYNYSFDLIVKLNESTELGKWWEEFRKEFSLRDCLKVTHL